MATRQAFLENVLQAPFLHATAVIATAYFLRLLYRRHKYISISYLPGPEKSDMFFGNLTDIYFRGAGEAHREWQEKYGQVLKVHGLLGVYNFQL